MIAGVEEEKEEPSVVFDVCYYFSLARSLARWLIAWPAAANGVIIRTYHHLELFSSIMSIRVNFMGGYLDHSTFLWQS